MTIATIYRPYKPVSAPGRFDVIMRIAFNNNNYVDQQLYIIYNITIEAKQFCAHQIEVFF